LHIGDMTLKCIAAEYGLALPKTAKRPYARNIHANTKIGIVSAKIRKVFKKERKALIKMIGDGARLVDLFKAINKKYSFINEEPFRRHLRKDMKLYVLLAKKQNELRAIKNVDCGKYKGKRREYA